MSQFVCREYRFIIDDGSGNGLCTSRWEGTYHEDLLYGGGRTLVGSASKNSTMILVMAVPTTMILEK